MRCHTEWGAAESANLLPEGGAAWTGHTGVMRTVVTELCVTGHELTWVRWNPLLRAAQGHPLELPHWSPDAGAGVLARILWDAADLGQSSATGFRAGGPGTQGAWGVIIKLMEVPKHLALSMQQQVLPTMKAARGTQTLAASTVRTGAQTSAFCHSHVALSQPLTLE